jgi:apolipoprotein D and lipocalin family protein
MRKGMGQGMGSGWKNMLVNDSHRHSLASKGIKTAQKVKAIPKLNVTRYAGRWYQVAAFPTSFQAGCKDSQANYTPQKGYISVQNTCLKDGKQSSITGKATAVNPGKSKLKVDFTGLGLFAGDYWVLYTDYNTALVGTPDRKYLWILGRKRTIARDKMDKLKGIATKQGFDVSKLS